MNEQHKTHLQCFLLERTFHQSSSLRSKFQQAHHEVLSGKNHTNTNPNPFSFRFPYCLSTLVASHSVSKKYKTLMGFMWLRLCYFSAVRLFMD